MEANYNPFPKQPQTQQTSLSTPSIQTEQSTKHNPFVGSYGYSVKKTRTTKVKYVRKQN